MQSGEWSYLSVEEASRENVHDLVGDEEYLLVILPDGSKLVRPMFKYNACPFLTLLTLSHALQKRPLACVLCKRRYGRTGWQSRESRLESVFVFGVRRESESRKIQDAVQSLRLSKSRLTAMMCVSRNNGTRSFHVNV